MGMIYFFNLIATSRRNRTTTKSEGVENMKVERTFNGSNNLEEILLSIIKTHIDKLNKPDYDGERANTMPSQDTEGMAS